MWRLLSLALAAHVSLASPLWDYVNKDDGSYSYYDTGIILRGGDNASNGWTGYLLNMTSQTWVRACMRACVRACVHTCVAGAR